MRWFYTLLLVAFWPVWLAAAPAPVLVLAINGAIGPATADYVHRGIEHARAEGAQLLVLQMDTPGGLDTSMRAIIKDILAAPMPVAAFVAPAGATNAATGIGAARISLMMARIEVSSPPGVSICSTSNCAPSARACSMPRCT